MPMASTEFAPTQKKKFNKFLWESLGKPLTDIINEIYSKCSALSMLCCNSCNNK